MEVSLRTARNRVDFFCRREECASYRYDGAFSGFRALFSGDTKSVTSQDESTQLGLWVEHGALNGYDFSPLPTSKAEKGAIETEELTARRGSHSSGFSHILSWNSPQSVPLLRETRVVRVSPSPCEGNSIEIAFEFENQHSGKLCFGATDRSFLRLKLASALTPSGGGQIRDSLGNYYEKSFEERNARWVSAIGVVGGETCGIVMLDHPGNLWFPSPWNLTQEGVLSPTPFLSRELTLEPGEKLALKYRLLIHRGYVDAGWATERLNEWVFG